MRRALAAFGVGSVELSQASVYHTDDAEELERVLLAIAEPLRERRVKAALATTAMGRDAAALARLAGRRGRAARHAGRLRALARAVADARLRRDAAAVDERRGRRRPPARPRRRRAPAHQPDAPGRAAAAGRRQRHARGAAAHARQPPRGRQAAARPPSCGWNPTATWCRSSPSTAPRAWNTASCSAPSCSTATARGGSEGPMRAWHDDDGELVLDYRDRRLEGQGGQGAHQVRAAGRGPAPDLRRADARGAALLPGRGQLRQQQLRSRSTTPRPAAACSTGWRPAPAWMPRPGPSTSPIRSTPTPTGVRWCAASTLDGQPAMAAHRPA